MEDGDYPYVSCGVPSGISVDTANPKPSPNRRVHTILVADLKKVEEEIREHQPKNFRFHTLNPVIHRLCMGFREKITDPKCELMIIDDSEGQPGFFTLMIPV